MKYELVDSKRYTKDSFCANKKIYKTKYDNIWIAEFNVFYDSELPKDVLFLFGRANHSYSSCMISIELLENEDDTNEEIEYFKIIY